MKRATLLAIAALSGLMAASVSADSFQEKVLWMDQEKSRALFIPEAVSRDHQLDELPLDGMDRGSLAGAIWARAESRPCVIRQGRDRQGTAQELRDLTQMLEFPPTVFVGRVVEVVEGWNNWRLVVGRMAYIEVEERIKPDLDPRVGPGKVFAVFFEGGETTVAGERLCFDAGTEVSIPAVGDKFIVGGVEWDGDESFFNAFVRFPVVAGRVLPEPYPELRSDAASRSLEQLTPDLRQNVRREPN